jgi:uncharacterized protein (DUF924 family)
MFFIAFEHSETLPIKSEQSLQCRWRKSSVNRYARVCEEAPRMVHAFGRFHRNPSAEAEHPRRGGN